MTPLEQLKQRNQAANQYRREAQKLEIASPYRQGQYIKARLQGKSSVAALKFARNIKKEGN